MSDIYFISDLHLGHKKILEFSPSRGGSNVDEHDAWIVSQWNSVIVKRDIVYVLGDVCFDIEKMKLLSLMAVEKRLILGNHDVFPIEEYLKYFTKVYGLTKYKGFWLSHSPIHPEELRGKLNIHGHVHNKIINDPRYISVCVEALNGKPISLTALRKNLNA